MTSDEQGVCPTCGAPVEPGDYRCEGEFPDGSRCGKDLVDIPDDRDRHAEVIKIHD